MRGLLYGGAVPNWISEKDSEAIASPQPIPPPPPKYQIGDRIEAPYIDQFPGEEEVREGEVRGVQRDKLMVQFILRAGRWQRSQIQSVAHDALCRAKAKIETLWGQFWGLVAMSPDIPAAPRTMRASLTYWPPSWPSGNPGRGWNPDGLGASFCLAAVTGENLTSPRLPSSLRGSTKIAEMTEARCEPRSLTGQGLRNFYHPIGVKPCQPTTSKRLP